MIHDAELDRIVESYIGNLKDPTPIDTAAKYHEVVPLVLDLVEEKKLAYAKARRIGEVLDALINLSGVYAVTEEDGLDEPLAEVRSGTYSGLVEIDGTDYRLTKSPGDPKRLDKSNVTQGFMDTLPDGWTKPKTGRDLNVPFLRTLTPSVLRSKGLCIPDKFEWNED